MRIGITELHSKQWVFRAVLCAKFDSEGIGGKKVVLEGSVVVICPAAQRRTCLVSAAAICFVLHWGWEISHIAATVPQ